ncbi:L-threonylcarbamoyladenylate synthase [Actinomadura madurae]|uniref:L-threonylcarbamoyladenylate synthase n=1 Tax=Actinomadura madurae TaxID=1993 RepID=UPI00399AD33A
MASTDDIERAAGVLRAGGLVAFPTETVNGLGGNPEDSAAVARIFQVKGRPASYPLIVHIGGAEYLEGWVAEVPATARRLAERFWPGPLTLVLRRGLRMPLEATGGLETVAVRVVLAEKCVRAGESRNVRGWRRRVGNRHGTGHDAALASG